MTEQAAIAIQGNIIVELEAARKQELEFLGVVSQVSSELELTPAPENHYHNLDHARL